MILYLWAATSCISQAKTKELKTSLNNEFRLIHELCVFVLCNTRKPDLIRTTLDTLAVYLTWVPLGYIFESNLLQVTVLCATVIPQHSICSLLELTAWCAQTAFEGPRMGQLGTWGGTLLHHIPLLCVSLAVL